MPRLIILRLPNDHTAGTRVGKPTPTAHGRRQRPGPGPGRRGGQQEQVLEGHGHLRASRTTPRTAPTTWTRIAPSPWSSARTRSAAIVDSTMYSTSSMLRTMELILGLKPMSQFDAAARPMYHSFQAKPDLRPYEHVVPEVDLKEKNKATAWGAKLSEKFDLAKEDAADDLLFNEVIWRSVKGRELADAGAGAGGVRDAARPGRR